ncbi:pyridoxamine 5'-phosphate oxidase family protein [Tistrella bauzanensis]|uniref:Pyridoxamine 5'-phosphate oxidase family protein n=1 Tax=Tistrella arctica TaxID=3133430 RepID=A0ABU9YIB5_9PROT
MARQPYHEGERAAHRRFGVTDAADAIADMITDRLSLGVRRFIEARPLVFVATTDAAGRPVCAVMARTGGADRDPPPLVRAPDARRLIFAIDEPENTTGGLDVLARRLQDSRAADDVGIGLLFVDFARRARYRVNGSGRLASDIDAVGWPAAAIVVELTVVQAYANCPARIVAPQPLPE